MEDHCSIATTSTQRDQNSFKAKRKLKLALPVANETEPSLTFNQSTSTFILEGQIAQADETDINSSSVSQARRNFFPKDRRMNFDVKGQYYYIRGRDNGKFMEDKVSLVYPQERPLPLINSALWFQSLKTVRTAHFTVSMMDIAQISLQNY